MRLTKERLEESAKLIREHLAKSHIDKDENSLFVRFCEITIELEELQFDKQSLNSALRIMSEIKEEK